MANTSADTRWIYCHALRRDEETRGDGPENSHSLSRYSSGGEREWRVRLRLIEPDGTIIDLSDSVDEAALAKIAAAEKAAAEEARLKAEVEAKAKEEAERNAREEAEAKARAEAEAKAKAEAEERARKEAEAKAKKEAEEKAKREAEEKARKEAEAKAKKEAEEKTKREAAEKARREAEAKAKKEAEAKARAEAEERARKEAEVKAKKEAEEKAKREAAEKARKEAEAKAKKEAEEKAKREAEDKAKREAQEKADREAEAKAKKEAQEKAKREAEEAAAKAKADEEAKRKAAAEIDLAAAYRRLIPNSGPISLAQYMGESNAKYYASRDPLGDEGDFITAPEVSQMFGELVGLWFADLWVKMGSSKNIHYVELGPGRGTLAQDALRTAGRYGFEPTIHFVEGSPALRDLQAEKFPKAIHHDDLSTLPEDRPLLIVANEFFDALPIKQLLRSADGWYERMIGLEDDALQFVAGKERMDDLVPPSWRNASQGTMIETSPAANAVMEEIATRLTNQGGAALIIDYGPLEARAGSTLQALKNHASVDPLAHPGEADITAHVDFERLSQVAKESGAEVMGLQMQGEWLHQMGIDTRLEALKRKNPNDEEVLQRQYDRLMRDDQMGTLFKVLGVCGRRWPIGAGFE
ncbi:MAG: SAM-dependent methyltransferase [Pseudomonadota bacterium]